MGVVAGGEALSLARATPAAFPAFGVVTVLRLGWGEDARVGKGPHPMRPHLLPFPLTLISISHTSTQIAE